AGSPTGACGRTRETVVRAEGCTKQTQMSERHAPPTPDPRPPTPVFPGPRPPAPGPFLMAGGGTGGHVIPALAVARELRARGHRVSFVGTKLGMEARLVPAEGFPLHQIHIGGLNGVG